MIFFSTLLISMFITMALIPLFSGMAVKLNALDIPDERKVHHTPIPRSGGPAMALGAILPVLFWEHGDNVLNAILIGSGIIVLFGMIDDFKNIGFKEKFAGQVIASLIVILYGGIKIKSLGLFFSSSAPMPEWFAIPLTIFVIVGVTNAINLSDGLDGLAGGISLLSFASIGYLAYTMGNTNITILSTSMVGVIFGFLRFNTYPASLFMGDAGSQLLGFLAAVLSLSLTQENTTLSPLLPLFLLGLPVLDTLTVMFTRIYNKKSPFKPDMNHFHHKIIRLGFYHNEAVVLIYIIQILMVMAAVIFRFQSEWFLMILYITFAVTILAGFFIAGKTGWKLKRYDLLEKVIKGRLRVIKEKNIIIKVSFRLIIIVAPLLLLFTSFIPTNIPVYFSIFTAALSGLIIVCLLTKNQRWIVNALRVALFLSIPVLIYLSEVDIAIWMKDRLGQPYNLSFGFLLIAIILTLKFTRRKNGFRMTPMDFLILILALVVPNLPDEKIQSFHMGLISVKIIILLLGFEVLIGESRMKFIWLGFTTVPALLVISVRGLMG